MNKRYSFTLKGLEEEEFHQKYGADPAEALFRYQLEILRSGINPRLFRTMKRVKKISPKET